MGRASTPAVFLLVLVTLVLALAAAGCRSEAPAEPATLGPTATATMAAATVTPAPPTGTPGPPASPTVRPLAPPPTGSATATPTAAPTATPSPIRFAVIGDYGQAGQPAADVAALVDSWQVDFIITTGDNNYPSGAAATIDDNIGQYYAAYIFPYEGSYGPGADDNRFFPSPGNHDWETDGLAPYLAYFELPGNERYYDFEFGPVHFFALNSDYREPDGISQGSVQAAWLEQALAAAEAPWKIVYMHVPPYSSGIHGSSTWMRWPYATWGASAVLSGHNHVYERVVLDGFPYLTVGLSGHPSRYPFRPSVSGSQVRYNNDYGAILAEATESELRFQFITRAGVVIDGYTLNR